MTNSCPCGQADKARKVLNDLPESFWHVYIWLDGPVHGYLDSADRLRIIKGILGEDNE